jgi:hypothetical protein
MTGRYFVCHFERMREIFPHWLMPMGAKLHTPEFVPSRFIRVLLSSLIFDALSERQKLEPILAETFPLQAYGVANPDALKAIAGFRTRSFRHVNRNQGSSPRPQLKESPLGHDSFDRSFDHANRARAAAFELDFVGEQPLSGSLTHLGADPIARA